MKSRKVAKKAGSKKKAPAKKQTKSKKPDWRIPVWLGEDVFTTAKNPLDAADLLLTLLANKEASTKFGVITVRLDCLVDANGLPSRERGEIFNIEQ